MASPKLESFNQRIVARCYLESFNREETQQYVQSQVKGVGASPGKLMTEDVYVALHQATDGVPRLINQLCDHALLLAFARGQRQITGGGQEAWADCSSCLRRGRRELREGTSSSLVVWTTSRKRRVGREARKQFPAPVARARGIAPNRPPMAEISRRWPPGRDFQPAGSISPEWNWC